MAEWLKGFLGGAKAATPTQADDDFADIADYATPAPSPLSHSAPSAADTNPIPALPTGFATGARPYTKWYRVWERTQLSDFQQEMFVLPVILIMVMFHVWGKRSNKRKARAWIAANGPILQEEFVTVGFNKYTPPAGDGEGDALLKREMSTPDELLREKKADEYTTYASGRQNIAFVDIKLTLLKRYNPLLRFAELLLSFVFDSMPATVERMEAIAYAFDGRESQLVPPRTLGGAKTPKSEYDGFVWAIVHKDMMKRLRNDRYDLSLTTTKDHPKLPVWATVMVESAEMTETLLTPELIEAINQAGEALDGLIVSDQPTDRPRKLKETVPKKRISLALRLPPDTSASAYEPTKPIFHYFLRMADQLVKDAHFRPEVMRRVKQTREDEIRKLKKLDEDEKRELHKLEGDKRKKQEREAKLKNLSAEEQRKFLDKEREKERGKAQRRRTTKA